MRNCIPKFCSSLLAFSVLSWACGDNDTSTLDASPPQDGAWRLDAESVLDAQPTDAGLPDAESPDAEPLGCEEGNRTQTPHRRAVITTSLYQGGGALAVVDLQSLEVTTNVAEIPEDAVTRWYDDRLWVLGRFNADNLTILDASDYRLLGQFSLEIGRNPQDIVCVSRCECYVSGLDKPDLLVIDPTKDPSDAEVARIDLSGFADADGLPESAYMAYRAPYLFVVLQRLDHDNQLAPAGNGAIAVVDTRTRQLVDTDPSMPGIQAIELPCRNPFSPLHPIPGTEDLLVSCVGSWQEADCGDLVRVDTQNFQATSLELDCASLPGKITEFTLQDASCGFAVLLDSQSYESGLYRFCLDGTGIQSCIDMGALQNITDAALTSDGRLLVTDGDFNTPGIRVYDPNDCSEITQSVLATGYPPAFADPILLVP